MIKTIVIVCAACTLISGCASEKNYRGVPAPLWKHLSAEQKQLVVDRSYEDALNVDNMMKKSKE